MKGRRIYPNKDGKLLFAPGDYGFENGEWLARPPKKIPLMLRSLEDHDVVEHEDGTITVSPSIKINRGDDIIWHGYLEKGIWRES